MLNKSINNVFKYILKVTIKVTFFCIVADTLLSQETLFEFSASKFLLGTKIDITAVNPSIDSMKKATYFAFKEMERIQGVMSSQIDSSEISVINSSAGIRKVKVSFETFSIISRSIAYSEKYSSFDISIGPIAELWGFNSDSPVTKVPPRNVIDSLIELVDYKKIKLDPQDTSVFLIEMGMKLDLGGIAKGYAIDRAAILMKRYGMSRFFINAGGDIYTCGSKSDKEKWKVGIQHPRNKNLLIAEIEIPNDGAIATSGDYERFAIIDGKRYHHIFDVNSGYPADISQSATSFAATAEEAVVLSKVLFIEGGEKYVQSNFNIPCIIVTSSGNVVYNPLLIKSHKLVLFKN